jgi:aminobenzoyl-glutamate utilization protein B
MLERTGLHRVSEQETVPNLNPNKAAAVKWIDDNTARLSDDHMTIWHFHEPAWREYKSAAWYVERLRADGFKVEAGSGGMPTAFVAEWSNGEGPTIGGYAEYDAVPGHSQDPVPRRQPRAGVSRHAAGHTDPHSALGITTLAGFLAAKHVMEQRGIKGRLKYFGEPAEKMCGSKAVHAAKGYLDDLDAAISFHPHAYPTLANGCFWDTQSVAMWSKVYTFECQYPERWQTDAEYIHRHSRARAPGAIDALFQMYSSTKATKEAMLSHQGGWSMNEFILNGGQATSDNLAPALAQIQYTMRAPNLGMCEKMIEVLDRNAEHCAAMTHCTVTSRWIARTRPGLTNHVMADVTWRNFEAIGAPRWNEESRVFGREIQKSLGLTPMENPFAPEIEQLTSPQDGEKAFRQMFPPWQMHTISDDYTDYTWHAPTVRFYAAHPELREPTPGYRYPDWVRNAMGGVPACIDPMIMTGGKVIATTILDLLTDGISLQKAKAEFRDRTGGGIGGTKWVAPLLPKDFAPPIDYSWPEYITTARGEEWSVRSGE